MSAPVARVVSTAGAILLLLLILLPRSGVVGVHGVAAVAANQTTASAAVLRLAIVLASVIGARLLVRDWLP